MKNGVTTGGLDRRIDVDAFACPFTAFHLTIRSLP